MSESEEAHKRNFALLHLKTKELEEHCKHLADNLDKQQRKEAALRSILATSSESLLSRTISHEKRQQYQNKRDSYFSLVRKAWKSGKDSADGIKLSVS